MRASQLPASRPAPVATLPPRGGFPTLTFSVARTLTFSKAGTLTFSTAVDIGSLHGDLGLDHFERHH